MQHGIILRAAIGLVVFLLGCSIAFAFAVTQRERRQAAMSKAPTAAYDANAAAAAYEARCSMCHEAGSIASWPGKDGPGARDALHAFLGKHGKAPDAENAAIATWLAASAPRTSP